MPQIYITAAERYIRSFLPNGRFNIEHHELYGELITPRMVKTLVGYYGADDARDVLEYVVEHIEGRRAKARTSLNRYSLDCYAGWLRDAAGRIAASPVAI
jgi:hypothetical protein